MPDYLVEVYVGKLESHELAAVCRRAGAARTPAGEATGVRYIGSIAIPADETCFHLYSGPTAAAVTAAVRRAAIPVMRIVEAVRLGRVAPARPFDQEGSPPPPLGS